MDYTIIDAHSHLWLYQDTEVDGLKIKTTENGQSLFMGEVRQMLPPFMIDGRNTAEVFLANMNYAQVGGAVVTQEYIDGIQNDYLLEVMTNYPDRFFVCGMCEFRKQGYFNQTVELIDKGFKAIKIPGHRLQLKALDVKTAGRFFKPTDCFCTVSFLFKYIPVLRPQSSYVLHKAC